MDEKAALGERPKPAKKPQRNDVSLVFTGERDHGSGVGRLTCDDITLERGKPTRVTPLQAKEIMRAFSDRYEIEEVE